MIRIVIENILLFLAPAIVYISYAYLTRDPDRPNSQVISDAPVLWLFIAGAALVLTTLIVFSSTSGGRPGQKYVPPAYKDGRIVPGEVK